MTQDSAGESSHLTNFKATLNPAWNSNNSFQGKHKSCTGAKCTTQNKKKRCRKTFQGIICILKNEVAQFLTHMALPSETT